jgi:hypothetical protein
VGILNITGKKNFLPQGLVVQRPLSLKEIQSIANSQQLIYKIGYIFQKPYLDHQKFNFRKS